MCTNHKGVLNFSHIWAGFINDITLSNSSSHLWSTSDGRCWVSVRCLAPWKNVRLPRWQRRRCSGWTPRSLLTRIARVRRYACPRAFSNHRRCLRPRPFRCEHLRKNRPQKKKNINKNCLLTKKNFLNPSSVHYILFLVFAS